MRLVFFSEVGSRFPDLRALEPGGAVVHRHLTRCKQCAHSRASLSVVVVEKTSPLALHARHLARGGGASGEDEPFRLCGRPGGARGSVRWAARASSYPLYAAPLGQDELSAFRRLPT